MKKKININDIKQALLDERFRSSLPDELLDDVQQFLKNPGCACNHHIYLRIYQKAKKQLAEYFPNKETPSKEEVDKKINKMASNEWQVINCSIEDLGTELRKLGPGRKQLDVARWEDQVTVVVNHLESVF